MTEYTMYIRDNYDRGGDSPKTTEFSFSFSAHLSSDDYDKIIGDRFIINVSAGLYDELSSGSVRINKVVLRSATTTFASYNTSFTITPADGTNTRRSIDLVVTDLPKLIKETRYGGGYVDVYFTKYNTSGAVWGYIGVPAQEVIFNTLNLKANTPKRVCGEPTPTFNLSATSDAPSGDVQYRWLYSEQGLNEWMPINDASTSLDYTWVLDDALISGGKSYDVVLECTTYNMRSNVVRATIYSAPSASGTSVSPTIGVATTQIELQCSSIQDPSNSVYPLKYQWQYNSGTPDEWIALGGATSQTYSGQFTTTTRETRFRLQVKNVDGTGYSDEAIYTAYVPTFPLNVEIGSPQYTTVSQINYSAGTSASVQVTPTTSGTTPVSNSYYTFQSQDGEYWITGYVGKWTNNGGIWTADIIWSSSNTDALPAQSICWCIWAKEYYDSLITQIGSEVDWSEITGKPETYSPSLHAATHASGGSDPVTPASIGAAPADHSHDTPDTISWQNVTDKPDEFAPSPHAATHGSDGGDPIALDASQIASGIVPLERLPHGCLERLVIVANDEARFALTTAQVQQGDTVKVESTQMMYFVVDESKLNSPDGYVAYTAGAASAVDWSAVTGKPETYPPSAHTHTAAQITDFNSAVDTRLSQLGISAASMLPAGYSKQEATVNFPGSSNSGNSQFVIALGSYNGYSPSSSKQIVLACTGSSYIYSGARILSGTSVIWSGGLNTNTSKPGGYNETIATIPPSTYLSDLVLEVSNSSGKYLTVEVQAFSLSVLRLVA